MSPKDKKIMHGLQGVCKLKLCTSMYGHTTECFSFEAKGIENRTKKLESDEDMRIARV